MIRILKLDFSFKILILVIYLPVISIAENCFPEKCHTEKVYQVTNNDYKYQWFNIISLHRSDCVLAWDTENVNPNCPGSAIVANDLEPNKLSQQWRISGNMIINRSNGLAVKVDNNNNLVFAHPTNAKNQQFSKQDNNFIFANPNKDRKAIVQLGGGANSNVGSPLVVVKGGRGQLHQFFRWAPFKFRR